VKRVEGCLRNVPRKSRAFSLGARYTINMYSIVTSKSWREFPPLPETEKLGVETPRNKTSMFHSS
jgi:hypothetical protein